MNPSSLAVPEAPRSVVWEPTLPPEAAQWRDRAVKIADDVVGPLAATLDEDNRYPWETLDVLRESGLTGLVLPSEFGGQGASLLAATAVAEELAKACASTCTVWMSYVVGAIPLLREGTMQQKERYLPGIARGDGISFALTERHTGSDASTVRVTATPTANGFHIHGEKWLVGNGSAARYFIVFARMDDHSGLTAFIIDREDGGVEIDEELDKMGLRGASTTNLRLNCRVPKSSQLGNFGKGLGIALNGLSVGRILVSAQGCGMASSALALAVAHACERRTFGRAIIDHQGVGFRLADLATELTSARMMTYEVAGAFDRGDGYRELSSMVKLYTSEMAHRAVDTAVQVLGAAGYTKPHPVERLYRDQRVLEIYEGSSEMQRLTITRGLKRLAATP